MMMTRVALLHLRQQLDAAAAGHADVAHQHLRRVVLQRLHHLLGVGEGAHTVLLARQRLLEHESDGLIVVDDPDGFHAVRALRSSVVRAGV
jgi:hypothetical protein